MPCSISLRACCEIRAEIRASDEFLNSIFEKTESWLTEDSDRMHAIETIADGRVLRKYRSIFDMLLCELSPDFQKPCFLYYEDKGPKLYKMVSAKFIGRLDNYLLRSCQSAYLVFCNNRKLGWAKAAEIIHSKQGVIHLYERDLLKRLEREKGG